MNREMSGPHFMHKEGRYELMGFGRSWFCREQVKRRVEGGGGGGGQSLGPRNDVLTTCKAVTLRGGQRKIAVFFPQ